MNELQIQRELCVAANRMGGHAFKCNNQFLVGVADLSITLPGYPHVYLEVKYVKSFTLKNTVCLNNKSMPTHHQRRFMRQIQEAGGYAGWVLVVGMKPDGRVAFYVSSNYTFDKDTNLCFNESWVVRERGAPWPIQCIIDRLIQIPQP